MITVPQFILGRTAALIAAGIAVFALFCLGVVPVYALFREQAVEVDDALNQIGQYNARIAAAPQLEQELKSLQDRGRSYPGVIVSESTAIAQAQLQGEVKAIIESNNGVVQSAQIVPAVANEGFDDIQVQYDFAVPTTHLKDLLFGIETHTPYLFVDHVEIDTPFSYQAPNAAQNDPLLQIRLVVRGYRWSMSR